MMKGYNERLLPLVFCVCRAWHSSCCEVLSDHDFDTVVDFRVFNVSQYSDFNLLTAMNSRKHPYTLVHRMRKNKPVIVHGDGTSLWTITHNTDFARGLVGLFGNPDTIGEAFYITSDEVLDWDRIYTHIAHAAGVDANLIHIASDYLGEWDPNLRESLLGDHACSAVFDNSKIKKFVPDFVCKIPFAEGARRSIAWFDADPQARATVDSDWDEEMDELVAVYRAGVDVVYFGGGQCIIFLHMGVLLPMI